MKTNPEYDKFERTMKTILKANPAVVKSAMEAEREEREELRKGDGKKPVGRPRNT